MMLMVMMHPVVPACMFKKKIETSGEALEAEAGMHGCWVGGRL
jgi:hypothetical protein